MSTISAGARQELVTAVAERYQTSTAAEKRRILDEFVALTGYHQQACHPRPQRRLSAAGNEARAPVCVRRGRDRGSW